VFLSKRASALRPLPFVTTRQSGSAPPFRVHQRGSIATDTSTWETQALKIQVEPPPILSLGEQRVYADATIPAAPRRTPEPSILEDPDGEFTYVAGEVPRTDGPRVINVGVPGPGVKVNLWRRAWRDKILPAVVNFAPDLIIVSAGFDAHRKDEINFQFVGVREHDFAWVTDQIVQVRPLSWLCALCAGSIVAVTFCSVHNRKIATFAQDAMQSWRETQRLSSGHRRGTAQLTLSG
jgi:hypothetical protein